MWLELFTVLVGFGGAIYAGHMAQRFFRVHKQLSTAFAYNLLGQSVASTLTMCFGILQLTGHLHHMSDTSLSCLSFLLYMTLLVPTVNLKRTVSRIENGE